MGPDGRGGSEEQTTPSPNPRDGRIDFSCYSTEQLQDLLDSFDREAFPVNFANLRAELDRRVRSVSPNDKAAGSAEWSVRFTRSDGARGWLQAKRRGLALYGSGTVDISPGRLLVRGWQRTWLAAPAQTEISISTAAIDGVAREDSLIRIETARSGWRRRRIEVIAANTETAEQIAGRLPSARSRRFERRYVERRAFEHRLHQATPRVWATPALVAINIAVFIAMLISQRNLGPLDVPHLLAWGANLGSFTANGQWWRLLTELFLHVSVYHIAVNLWVLWNIGRLVERLFGSVLFLCLYLVCGSLSSLGSLVWNPGLLTVGASGAIFALFGAFFAYLLRRRGEVPWSMARAHWLSTAVFVLFSLFAGMLQQGIDNAAHVTGLATGFGLGWILARPMVPTQSRVLAVRQLLAAASLVAGLCLLGSWQVLGLGTAPSPSEDYYRQHGWLTDESVNLQLWQQLAARLQSGQISTSELTERFQRDIVPFWQRAATRLKAERARLPARDQAYASLMLDYVNHRLDWARAVAAFTSLDDRSQVQEALRLAHETDLIEARIERIGLRVAMDHRSRGWVDSEPMIGLRSLLAVDRGRCVRPPPIMGPSVATTDQKADSPTLADASACAAQRAFALRQFRSLDKMMDQSEGSLADLPDGNSRFAAVVRGVDNLLRYGSMNIDEALAALAIWRRTRPDSVNPDLIEAMVFEDWAWGARGQGTVNTVSAQAMTLFLHRSEMAAAALEDTEARSKSNPLWYTLALRVGLDQSKSKDDLRSILDRGVARFPGYWPLYSAMLRALMPRWGGSYEQVDAFIRSMDQKLDADSQGYARLYWIYAGLEGDEVDIFSYSKLEWQRVDRGFETMLERYPHSDYLLNSWAYMACRANDARAYRSARLAFQAHYSATAWTEKYSMRACDQMLSSVVVASPLSSPKAASPLDASAIPLGAPATITSPDDLAVWADLTRAWKEEQQAVNAANALNEQLQQHKLSWAEWSQKISTGIVPTWEDIKDRLVAEHLPFGSKLEPLRRALLSYGDTVTMAFSLATEAGHSGEAGTGQWATEVMEHTKYAAAEVSRSAQELGVTLPQ